jgi:carbonic anhydrase/acetyltransferase-like protein (isoleucine patch superfamily)
MPVYDLGDVRIEAPADGAYWIAPTASVMGRVVLGSNASIWFGAVLRADNEPITIGENSNIQDNAVLHTDPGCPLTIGANVTVGHQSMLHGCVIGDGSLVGIQAVVLNRARIGRNCLIGAKSLVTEGMEIPDNCLVMGAPGKIVRTLSPDQAARIALGAQVYVANWKRFTKELKEHKAP